MNIYRKLTIYRKHSQFRLFCFKYSTKNTSHNTHYFHYINQTFFHTFLINERKPKCRCIKKHMLIYRFEKKINTLTIFIM